MTTLCQWCEKSPCTTSGQAKQRFCSPACRNAFRHALRAYGRRAFERGDVGLAELRTLRDVQIVEPPHV